jgi:hypothetical protein
MKLSNLSRSVIVEETEEYPVHDEDHTRSAIGYVMKYKDRDDSSGAKAKRNKAKVARAAHKFGLTLPDDW